MNAQILWYLSRTTGVAALVLLTVVLVLGLVLSGRRAPFGARTTVVTATHRWLSLGMTGFLAAHILTAVVDSYVDISWIDVMVPFVAGYEPLLTGLGTVGFDLVAAIVVTSLLRPRLPEKLWRAVHVCSFLVWPIALFHGVALGASDAPVLLAASLVCGGVGLSAIVWRLFTSNADERRRHLVRQQEWA